MNLDQIVYTCGALAFSILSVFYWGDRRRRSGRDGRATAFSWFTLICAAAFLNNLLLQNALVHDLSVGLLPPLILHVVSGIEERNVPPWTLAMFYALGVATMLVRSLSQSEVMYAAPAILLALAGAAGLLLQVLSLSPPLPAARAHRR